MGSNTQGALVVLSGGQDSTTCLFWAMREFDRVEAVTFDYQQRHKMEIECAKKICRVILFHLVKFSNQDSG